MQLSIVAQSSDFAVCNKRQPMQSYKIVPFHVAARETIVSPRNRMSIIMNVHVASRVRFNRPIVALTVSAKLHNYRRLEQRSPFE
jgi:hypothetical protein